MNFKIKVGSYGQKLAVDFLKQRNYQLVESNYYTRQGEIDLIAQKDGQIIFIEVKTRLSDKYGLPEEAVTDRKKEKMHQAAWQYLAKAQINHDNYRFDIIAIVINRSESKAIIRHHKNISE